MKTKTNMTELLANFIPTKEAAETYNVYPGYIRELISGKKVKAVKVVNTTPQGFKYLVSRDSLEKYFTEDVTDSAIVEKTPKLTMWTIPQTAKMLSMTEATVRKHIDSGKLKSIVIDGVHKITPPFQCSQDRAAWAKLLDTSEPEVKNMTFNKATENLPVAKWVGTKNHSPITVKPTPELMDAVKEEIKEWFINLFKN